jgi:hypothetical protein
LDKSLAPGASRTDRDRAQRELSARVMRERPKATLATFALGLLKTLGGSGLTAVERLLGSPEPEGVATTGRRVATFGLLVPLVVLYGCAATGALRGGVRGSLVPLACLAYFALTALGLHANTRFRFPMAPFLALLGAAASDSINAHVERRRDPSGGPSS